MKTLRDFKISRDKVAKTGVLVLALILVIGFQNCGGVGSSAGGGGNDSSVDPTPTPGVPTPTPTPVAVCPISNNPAPTILGVYTDATMTNPIGNAALTLGMDNSPYAGTGIYNSATGNGDNDPVTAGDQGTRRLYIRIATNDTVSNVDDVNCNDNGHPQLAANCNNTITAMGGGIYRGEMTIGLGQDLECGETAAGVSITINARDVLNNTTAPCQTAALRPTSPNYTSFTVNVTNGCRPTARRLPSTPVAGGEMGDGVAISGDWAVATAIKDSEANPTIGAAYVFQRSGGAWSAGTKLNISGLTAPIVSADISGTRIVLGAPGQNFDRGAVFIFDYNGTTWNQAGIIDGPTTPTGHRFGTSVSLSGNILAVGAPVGGDRSGRVYVFNGTTLVSTLQPSIDSGVAGDSIVGSNFGTSVSVSGSVLVVGAPFYAPGAVSTRKEAAYVFQGSGGAFALSRKLSSVNAFDAAQFGYSVATDGTRVVVGAPYHKTSDTQIEVGRAYLYQVASLSAAPTTLQGAGRNSRDLFGWSVAVAGNNIVVGAPTWVDGGFQGAAYQFSTSGMHKFLIRAGLTQRSDGDRFGRSVDLAADNTLMVGAKTDEENVAIQNSGAAYFINVMP